MYGIPGLLIAAAAGYWVLTLSAAQKGRVKKLGQYLGLLIVAVSIVGAGCKIYYQSTGQGYCAVDKGGYACPVSGKVAK